MSEITHNDIEQELNQEFATGQKSAVLRYTRNGLRFLDLGFFVLYGVILLQIALEALGARDSNGFKGFLDTASGPFLDPFRGLLNDPAVHNHQVMLSFIAALIIYALLQALIKRTASVALTMYVQSANKKANQTSKPSTRES